MSEPASWSLLARYLSGECSHDEMKKLEVWINSDVENKKLVEMMKMAWHTPEPEHPKSDVKALWQTVATKAGITPDSQVRKDIVTPNPIHRKMRWTKWHAADSYSLLRYAAILFVVITLGYIINRSFPIWQTDSGLITKTVENADREKMVLSDGTKLVLDAGSSFKYPEKFDGKTREVYLTGEGYFEVAPDPNKPFIIHANHAAIKVLGTRFNVRAWELEDKVTVAVAEGKVALQPDKATSLDSVILTRQQISSLPINGHPSEPETADVDKYMEWMQNVVFFEDAPLSEILLQLERWYDIKFMYDDSSLTKEHLNVHIKGDSITDVLNLLTALTDLQFVKNGKTVHVTK